MVGMSETSGLARPPRRRYARGRAASPIALARAREELLDKVVRDLYAPHKRVPLLQHLLECAPCMWDAAVLIRARFKKLSTRKA